MESVLDQRTKSNLTSLIDLGNQKVFKDKKELQVIKELCKDTVILKPGKVNRVVLIDTTNYYESFNKLFSDTTKFKRFDTDSTNIKLSTLQSYLQKLYNQKMQK